MKLIPASKKFNGCLQAKSLFTTKSKSGASCLSRCLIYKVHTALSGGSLSYHTVFVLSRTFFRFFNLFSFSQTPRRAAPYFARRLSRRLAYCSTSCSLCQELFSGIFRPVSIPSFRTTIQKCTALCRTASICYHAHPGLSSTFFDFFPFFFWRFSHL